MGGVVHCGPTSICWKIWISFKSATDHCTVGGVVQRQFALKQSLNEDDKTSFEEINKDQKEDLSTNDMEGFARNISGRH